MADSLTDRVRAEALRLGFDAVGITDVHPSDHAAFYREWLDKGRHGSMHYLERPDAVERRLHPERAWPGLRSAIVVAWSYPAGADDAEDRSQGVIARYARGRDYHRVMKPKLLALLRWLEQETGRRLEQARAYVDTGPVLEREFARRAGMGWFGRNTMLLHPRRGSYFFLGTLLVEVELEPDAPFETEHCGRCNACVEACPTGALLGRDANGAPVMDATRCISYLTIENRGPIPVELRPLIGNRIFGCDICQEVCPFNRKLPSTASESASLVELLETALDDAAWDKYSRGSAMRRAGRAGFARNVCVGLGNAASPEAIPVLMRALNDADPLVREHAAWALTQLA